MSFFNTNTPYPASGDVHAAASFSGILNRFHQVHPQTTLIKDKVEILSNRAMAQAIKLDEFQTSFPFDLPRTEIKGVADVLNTVSQTLTRIHTEMHTRPYTIINTPEFDLSTTNKDLEVHLDEVQDCFKIIRKAADPTKKILKPEVYKQYRMKKATKRFQAVKLQLSLIRIVLDAAIAHTLRPRDSGQFGCQDEITFAEQVNADIAEWLNDGGRADSPAGVRPGLTGAERGGEEEEGGRGRSLRERIRGSSVVAGVLQRTEEWKLARAQRKKDARELM